MRKLSMFAMMMAVAVTFGGQSSTLRAAFALEGHNHNEAVEKTQ